MNTITLDTVDTEIPGLAPWQPLRSGHLFVDDEVPGSLLGRSVQLRTARKGHGITADIHALVLSNALDGVVLYAHTRSKSDEHVRGMGLQHPSNRSIARNVRVKKVDTLAKLAKLVYKAVATSLTREVALPRLLVLDSAADLVTDEITVETVLEFLHAAAAYDLETMYQITGEAYEDVIDTKVPDLSGRCMAVVVYVTQTSPSLWGQVEHLPALDEVGKSWAQGVDSVVVLERFVDGNGTYSDADLNARLTFVKRTFVSAKKPPVGVPAHYRVTDGARPVWESVTGS